MTRYLKANWFFIRSSPLLFLIFIAFSSCRLTIKPDNDSALNALYSKYPQLHDAETQYGYRVTKTLIIADEKESTEMQLLENAYERKFPRVVIFSNSNGVYAVPLPFIIFYNSAASTQNLNGINRDSVFEMEINNAFSKLELNRRYHGSHLIDDMLLSLLKTQQLRDNDTVTVKQLATNSDAADTCGRKRAAIYTNILHHMKTGNGWDYHTYWDMPNACVFNLEVKAKGDREYYTWNVYHLPCTMELLRY